MDVIGIERDRDDVQRPVRRRPATGRRAPLTGGLAVAAALLGFSVGRLGVADGLLADGTAGELTGSMVLELQDGSYVLDQAVTDQMEYRDEDWQGTITLEASGNLTGAARLRGSASYVGSDFGPVVAHKWGTATVTLDGQSCTGTYAYSAYRSSDEGGGSMHLRCDGGSVLGATITADGTEPPSADGTRSWRITIAIAEGFLHDG